MSITIDKNLCKGCSLCISVCPKNVIEISKTNMNSKGYLVAEPVRNEDCINCKFCGQICPDMCIVVEKTVKEK